MIEKRSIVVSKTHLKSPKSDLTYWRSQPYVVRLATLEMIRREFHQWKYHAEPRFQRVYTITQQIRYPPNRIDLLTTPDGINFESCYNSKVEIEIENIKVNFIDLENLKINKKASGRLQDLADIENLSE